MGDKTDRALDPQRMAAKADAKLEREEAMFEAAFGGKRKHPRTLRRFVTRGGELVEVESVVRETR